MSSLSTKSSPELFGLILAGGKSQRMGADKASLAYYELPQVLHEAKLLEAQVSKLYISVSGKNKVDFPYPLIADLYPEQGPFGALLSAFEKHPDTAWLTLACDLPYLDAETLSMLIQGRNKDKLATCFYNSETDSPEPLVTIWEPSIYIILQGYFDKGNLSLRKVLSQSDIQLLKLNEELKLKNANTPTERSEALNYLAKK